VRRTLIVATAAAVVWALPLPWGGPGLLPPAAAIMGGAPVPGDPAVVELTITSGTRQGLCSALLWKPRVLLTAAHCVVPSGSGAPVDPTAIRVQPPGSTTTGPALTGLVVSVSIPAGFVNASTRVQPNDIAVLTLAAELGGAGVTRLASRAEIDAWTRTRAPVEHLGYGRTSPIRGTDIPHSLSLPLASYSPLDNRVRTLSTVDSSPCPGDSGGPVLRTTPGGRVSVGVFAGANATCTTSLPTEPSTIAFAPIGYLPVLNPALAAIGEPEVPTAPTEVTATVANRDITLTWQPPASRPELVAGYDVLDGAGNPVCATVDLTCRLPGMGDGSHFFTVRARNGQGEGDADVAGAGALVAPPSAPGTPQVAMSRGQALVRWSAPTGSAVVTRYTVRLAAVGSDRRRTLCTTTATAQSPPATECTAPVKPGTYRVVVRADTGMGEAPASPPSRRFTVRMRR